MLKVSAQILPEAGHFVALAVFGPVPAPAAFEFTTEEEALALAHRTDCALVAAVWTRNGDRLARLSKELAAGQCFINCHGAGGGEELPFGGMKRNGHGREKGRLALEAMSTTKTIVRYHG